MSKRTKLWLLIGASLVLIGCIIFGGVMMTFKWDFTKLSTVKFETNDYAINEPFQNISVSTDTADILFVPSEKCSVVCYEQKNATHAVAVKDGTLTVELNDTRKWYEHIGINLGAPQITVYLPESEYAALVIRESTGDIEIPKNFRFESMDITVSTGHVKNMASALDSMKIRTSTGNILVENISAGALDLSVSTGKVTARSVTCDGELKIKVSTGDAQITDVRCKALTSQGNTGDIHMEKAIAEEQISVHRSTGDVEFEKCDAAQITVKTDTGHVKGSLLSDKVFIVQTDTGRVDVPKTTTGGKCEITTDTGNIKIEIT